MSLVVKNMEQVLLVVVSLYKVHWTNHKAETGNVSLAKRQAVCASTDGTCNMLIGPQAGSFASSGVGPECPGKVQTSKTGWQEENVSFSRKQTMAWPNSTLNLITFFCLSKQNMSGLRAKWQSPRTARPRHSLQASPAKLIPWGSINTLITKCLRSVLDAIQLNSRTRDVGSKLIIDWRAHDGHHLIAQQWTSMLLAAPHTISTKPHRIQRLLCQNLFRVCARRKQVLDVVKVGNEPAALLHRALFFFFSGFWDKSLQVSNKNRYDEQLREVYLFVSSNVCLSCYVTIHLSIYLETYMYWFVFGGLQNALPNSREPPKSSGRHTSPHTTSWTVWQSWTTLSSSRLMSHIAQPYKFEHVWGDNFDKSLTTKTKFVSGHSQ